MKKKYFLIIIFLVVLIVGSSIWQLAHIGMQSQKAINTTPSKKVLPKEATVTLDKNGFSPKEVTIKVGGAVRWKNKSGTQATVNSDNYPTNQLHKELNFGVFNNGSSVVYTFTKPGAYGYHNQLHHEQTGKIIVSK